FQQPVQNFRRVARGKKHFAPVFAGITSSRDGHLGAATFEVLDLVARGQSRLFAEHRMQQFHHARSLDREPAVIRAPVLQLAIVAQMLPQPGEVFIDARRIHDQQKFVRRRPVNNQVVDNSAAVVQEKRVLPRADFELVDVVGEHLVQPRAHARTSRHQLAHVRNVEHADVLPHRLVLVDDPAVLHGHDPIAERNHLRTEPQVLVVERRLFCGLGHARILDVSPVEASRASSTVLAAMSFLDKLERRFGFIAIPGLVRAIVTLNVLVFILVYLNKGFDSYLALDVARIRAGEVWRLVTYIFVPQMSHPLLVLIALWFLWFIGDGLERAWGPFRLTLYFLVGMIGTTVAAVLSNSQFSNQMLFTTLFFAFAHFYPDEIIYVFFILPLKIKWIAWVYAAFLLLAFVTQSNSYRLALIAALSNYLIFFGPGMIQQLRQRKEVAVRRKRFEIEARSDEEPLHRCATCGATELSDPSLEFRVARDG